jgi:hypothetical protein
VANRFFAENAVLLRGVTAVQASVARMLSSIPAADAQKMNTHHL